MRTCCLRPDLTAQLSSGELLPAACLCPVIRQGRHKRTGSGSEQERLPRPSPMRASAVTREVSLHLGAMTSYSVLESLPPVTRGASAFFFFFTVSNVSVALLRIADSGVENCSLSITGGVPGASYMHACLSSARQGRGWSVLILASVSLLSRAHMPPPPSYFSLFNIFVPVAS